MNDHSLTSMIHVLELMLMLMLMLVLGSIESAANIQVSNQNICYLHNRVQCYIRPRNRYLFCSKK